MDGNEIKCIKCFKKIGEQECYECDCCQAKIHKQCESLSSSEMRVIPLQKRYLMFVCENCKKLLRKIPYIVSTLESIKKEFEDFKVSIEGSKDMQIQSLNKSIHDISTNNTQLAEKLLQLETHKYNTTIQEKSTTYAKVTSNQLGSKQFKNIPNLIIKPKRKQNSTKTKEDLQKHIKPAELKIGVKDTRETKGGSMVIKCQTKEEIEKLQKEVEKALSKDYEVHATKLRKPRVKIVGYKKDMSIEQIEEDLREQNHFIEDTDELKVTYIQKHRSNDTRTIYAECSPGLFHKLMIGQRVFLQWERYRVYEDISVPRCFKCQGFYHKNSVCNNKTVCEFCMGEHEIHVCPKINKKCVNCVNANQKFKSNYDINHEASSFQCPSYKYLIDVLKSKIDYGQQ